MYDSGKILLGIIIFVGLFTSPIWYDLASGKSSDKPNIILPTDEDHERMCCKYRIYACITHGFVKRMER